MSTEAHSEWSASGFKRIMLCPGSKVLEKGAPRSSSSYAAEGTAAHEVLEMCLVHNKPASAYLGRIIEADGFDIEVDEDMVENLQGVIDRVKAYAGDDGVIFPEQRLYYGEQIGVDRDNGWGTGDVTIAKGKTLIIIDLKYGKGQWVDVVENPQLMLYGVGALNAYDGIVDDFEEVMLVIDQPRINPKPSEWTLTKAGLIMWAVEHGAAAVRAAKMGEMTYKAGDAAWRDTFLKPGEEQCKFCKGKAKCPKLLAEVADTIGVSAASPEEFDASDIECKPEDQDAEWLAVFLRKVDLIEDWCKSVRAEADLRLKAGTVVPGWKLVQGKRGNRAWSNENEVADLLAEFAVPVPEMFTSKLKSPAAIEKLVKAKTLTEGEWTTLQQYITQAEGKPHVAPAEDPRPPLEIKPVTDDFEEIA